MGFEERKDNTAAAENRELKKNGSGYNDPTAYKAIKNADAIAESRARFHKMLEAIFALCEGYGFHLEEHITVKDKKTGKIWR